MLCNLSRNQAKSVVKKAIQARRNNSNLAVENLESRWKTFSAAEQNTLAKQLETAQKQDWKVLSTDDKKAAYYISFGAHGPRAPITEPGHGVKVAGGVAAALAVSAALSYVMSQKGQETPKTMTKEWQEATNEYLKSQNSNPISGISSEGFKGKGYVMD
ncbi:cytochrome c oxidase subunit IV [Phycomyces nitens]|nr:cytochrome c oxidase subunit IV [Phycomyces nitens]